MRDGIAKLRELRAAVASKEEELEQWRSKKYAADH